MIIDFHAHVGDLRSLDCMDLSAVTWECLLRRLDEEGIDKAVVLPLGMSPESVQAPFLFAPNPDVVSQVKATIPFRDRVIVFGNVDPRMGCAGNLERDQLANPPETDFSWLLARFMELGCVGIGEITANIPLDDPRMINLCHQCGRYGMPVLFHETGPGRGVYGLLDEAGSPRLERLLQAVPETILIGHATGFWAEISGEVTPMDKFTYPAGPVTQEGSLVRLLRRYSNLYADISAKSGLNAISRDPKFGARFLNEFQDRILFGTDVCLAVPDVGTSTLQYLRDLLSAGEICRGVFDKITGENALSVMPLYQG